MGPDPKPYGMLFDRCFEGGVGLRAPEGGNGLPDLRKLHVRPEQLQSLLEATRGLDERADDSATAVSEILNCSIAWLKQLVDAGLIDRAQATAGLGYQRGSAMALSRKLISFPEINARLGFRQRAATAWLNENDIALVVPGFAPRADVEAVIKPQFQFGPGRRKSLRLSLDEVEQGQSDLTDREWEFVRAWVPRRRRSRNALCDRSLLNAAIWVSALGRRWSDIPSRYGVPATCYYRYHHWQKSGALGHILHVLERERKRCEIGEIGPYWITAVQPSMSITGSGHLGEAPLFEQS